MTIRGWHNRQGERPFAPVGRIRVQGHGGMDLGPAETKPEDEIAIEPLSGIQPDPPIAVAGVLRRRREGYERTSSTSAPPSCSSISRLRRTGLGKPGSSTGGLIREASGTASVSTAVPSPTEGPGNGTPGMYRGATTSGNRNVTSPSE